MVLCRKPISRRRKERPRKTGLEQTLEDLRATGDQKQQIETNGERS